MVSGAYNPFTSIGTFNRRQERILALDLLPTFLRVGILIDHHIVHNSDVTVHTSDRGRQTSGKDGGVSDVPLLTGRVVNHNL